MADEATPNKHKKSERAQSEEKILAFWKDNKIFEKTLKRKSSKGSFVFFDGPPFATGLPHYGHLLASTIKDVIPRYKTMQGYYVERSWGWDCHGLPVENLIEDKLGLTQKSDIEQFGVERFNEEARKSVLEYDYEWKKIIPRLGRWVSMDTSYLTMDWTYTESLWWAFKELYGKGLVYEGYKSMHLCPRCETTLAVSEVAQGYKSIVDISVFVKFPLKDEPGTYFLAWTTTPWTLPGNVALAVGEGIEYAKVRVKNESAKKEEVYILAKDRLSLIEGEHELLDVVDGEDLVGKEYLPPFDYFYKNTALENKENGWKVYPASFVDVSEGTGIVHIAPAFGEEDLEVGRLRSLPFIQHITMDGRFTSEMGDFKEMLVKPRDDHQATDIEIIKYLAQKNLLFKKEKITHSYPHCWRCDTPLVNYATSSWFVSVTEQKAKLLSLNNKIHWIPHHIKEGRFGKWLLGARDWAVSRSRFWGAPIPVWKCDSCEKVDVIGSVDEIKEKGIPAQNNYILMRHGEALSNKLGVVNSIVDQKYKLTEKGKKQVQETAKKLSNKKIDIIITSPLPRTMHTAEIAAHTLSISQKDIIKDGRLGEISLGELEGKTVTKYHAYFKEEGEKFSKTPRGGENYRDVQKRTLQVLYELEKKYIGKTILIISHDAPLWMLASGAEGLHGERTLPFRGNKNEFLNTGEVRELSFVPLPHNTSFEIDLHKPYIDEVKLQCSCGHTMKRISEVFDCWFESGSMPYARFHYPFENKKAFQNNFPADFIAEGLDQTRGWFYNMLVLSSGIFGKSPFKNVIVNGLILAEDGQKMSKRLKNYPEPNEVIDKYGADALRFYMLSSPVVRGETLDFEEKGVREVKSRVIMRLYNVCSFYELYKKELKESRVRKIFTNRSENVLDEWILIRLQELQNKVSDGLQCYELDRATRPFVDFVDDFSTWYLRRSRDRFKGEDAKDKMSALETTQHVLLEVSKLTAPFMPFLAEDIYQRIRDDVGRRNTAESVHLERWPRSVSRIPVWPNPMALVHRIFRTNKDINALRAMEEVREIVSLGLEARSNAGIKVRQPLSTLWVKKQYPHIKSNDQLAGLIRDELNVKQVVFGATIDELVSLDLTITDDLKKEGNLRELIRAIQDLRKKEDLSPHEKTTLTVKTNKKGKELVGEFAEEIKNAAVLQDIIYEDRVSGEEVTIDSISFTLSL